MLAKKLKGKQEYRVTRKPHNCFYPVTFVTLANFNFHFENLFSERDRD